MAPASVQEMADFVSLGFDLAFKYNILSVILADGLIGQMMEKVVLPPYQPRRTNEEIRKECPWASMGRTADRKRNVITSLELEPGPMEARNLALQEKYRTIEANEVRFENVGCDDADYLLMAFGSSARICQKAIEIAAEQGIKLGLLRPITLWPFCTEEIKRQLSHVKGILSVEFNAGQMVEDIRLAVEGKVPVAHFGRMGGIVPTPEEVVEAVKSNFNL